MPWTIFIVDIPLGWGTSHSKFETHSPIHHRDTHLQISHLTLFIFLFFFLFLFAHFRKIAITYFSQFFLEIILRCNYSPVFVEIGWRTEELCVIYKNSVQMWFCAVTHTGYVNHWMKWLENPSERWNNYHSTNLLWFEKIKIMGMEFWQKRWPCLICTYNSESQILVFTDIPQKPIKGMSRKLGWMHIDKVDYLSVVVKKSD